EREKRANRIKISDSAFARTRRGIETGAPEHRMRLRGRPGATTPTQTPKSPKSAKSLEILHPPDHATPTDITPGSPARRRADGGLGTTQKGTAKEAITDDESRLRFYFRRVCTHTARGTDHGSMKTRAHGHAPTYDKDHDRLTRRPNENGTHGHGKWDTKTPHKHHARVWPRVHHKNPRAWPRLRQAPVRYQHRHRPIGAGQTNARSTYPVDTTPRRRYCPCPTRPKEPMAPTALHSDGAQPQLKRARAQYYAPKAGSQMRARYLAPCRRRRTRAARYADATHVFAAPVVVRGKEKRAHLLPHSLRGTRERSTRMCRAADGRRARPLRACPCAGRGKRVATDHTASRARTMRRAFVGLPARAACGRAPSPGLSVKRTEQKWATHRMPLRRRARVEQGEGGQQGGRRGSIARRGQRVWCGWWRRKVRGGVGDCDEGGCGWVWAGISRSSWWWTDEQGACLESRQRLSDQIPTCNPSSFAWLTKNLSSAKSVKYRSAFSGRGGGSRVFRQCRDAANKSEL
ncbi:hypothetical protein B0H17DRAFT_1236021, partial [Mycena rosella]